MRKIDRSNDLSEIPRSQRQPKPETLQHYEKHAFNRNEVIILAYASGVYSMKENDKVTISSEIMSQAVYGETILLNGKHE